MVLACALFLFLCRMPQFAPKRPFCYFQPTEYEEMNLYGDGRGGGQNSALMHEAIYYM